MSWPLVQLGDVADISAGNSAPQGQDDFSEEGTPFVRAGSLSDLLNGSTNHLERIAKGDAKRLKLRLFPKDSILFAKSGMSCMKGYVYRLPFEAHVVSHLAVVQPGPDLSPAYAEHALRVFSPVSLVKDEAYPSIRLPEISGLKIPLPPLEEQRRIAAILDQADALRRLRSRALDKLNTLDKANFHEMFGDVRSQEVANTTLGECAEFYSGNTLPDGEPFAGQQDGYLILKVSDLNRPSNAREITESAAWSPVPGSRASTCPAGAIVFPKRGGAIGTNKKRILMRPAILDPNLMGVSPNADRMNIDFLSGWFSLFTLSDIASGSSVPQLNKKDLAPLKLKVPDIELQRKFSDYRDETQRIWQRNTEQMAIQEALFAALQHRAFQGEL
jgi:type I restriction enzyme S subunit